MGGCGGGVLLTHLCCGSRGRAGCVRGDPCGGGEEGCGGGGEGMLLATNEKREKKFRFFFLDFVHNFQVFFLSQKLRNVLIEFLS